MTHKIKRYSEAFRRQVVSEYESGISIPNLQKKYGIGGSHTIQKWVRKYGREGLRHEVMRIQSTEEANRVRELEKEVRELQQALGKMTLENLKLESILETQQVDVEEQVKKNALKSSTAYEKKLSNQTGYL